MMMNQEEKNVGSEHKYLTVEEESILKVIAGGQAPHGQRAGALLALDEGKSQAEAAEIVGLTPGSVKYWLGKYKKARLEIFPDFLLNDATAKIKPDLVPEVEEESVVVGEGEEAVVSESAEEKAKKPKGKKGKKKGKKG
ncbi:MAG: helix-turn-helix domain-containing protein, partial [Chloroflexota bacterium]